MGIGIFMEWVKAMAHDCGSWGCVDQEKLTTVLIGCGWRPIDEFAQVEMLTNDQQELSCPGLPGAERLRLDALPIRFFGDGKSEDLLRTSVLREATGGVPGRVFTYHPNFSGF